MLKNPLYQYGSPDLQLPVNLNFSEFIINKLVEFKRKTIVNGLTDETITYGEIAQQSMNLAISLGRLGVRKGQTVGICSENRIEYISAIIGSMCTGAVVTTFNMMYTKHEISHVASISKPKYIICSPQAYKNHEKTFKSLKFIEKIIVFGDERPSGTISFNDLVSAQTVRFEEFRAADVDCPDETLFILYSSGTTGLPKGVMLTHRNVLICCNTKGVESSALIKYLLITPWFHSMGLMGTLLQLTNGRDIVFLPKFEIDLYLRCIEKYKVTRLTVVPPIIVVLIKYPNKYDVSSVDSIYSGAAPLTKEIAEAVNGLTDETITYGEIAQQSMNLAISLGRLGVRKGQTVGICSENRIEYISAIIGTMCTGAVVTTFNMMYTKHEISHVASISKPKYIICSPQAYKNHEKTFKSLKFIEKIIVFGDERPSGTISFNDLVSAQTVRFEEFRAADVDCPDETLFILYSSGTTGLPKGVMLTHRNVLICCNTKGVESSALIKYLLITPWFHSMGLMGTLLQLTNGRDIVFLPKFEIDLYLRCIEKYKVTRLTVVPPIIVVLIKYPNKYDVSSVDSIYSGAAPLTKEIAEAVRTKFPNVKSVLQGYGMTETTLAIAKDNDESAVPKVGGVGTVVSGAIIKILDLKTRKPLGANQPGEICVKSGLVMKGYVGKDKKEDFDDEGFFRTGDVGYYDEDGYFFIVDRLKELIKYKGFQVAPAELEAVLLQHAAVRDAGVVGVPDARAGELPRAFVALQPGAQATADELQAFVAERLSSPKWLRGGVRFVPEIPKNPSGKILRRELRALAMRKSNL